VSVQGRFTSADPLLSSGTIYDPQSWNRYTYTLNNPLKYTDPFGLYMYAAGTTDEQKKKFEQGLKDLQKARDSFKKGSGEYNRLDRAYNAYGAKGVDNGVTVRFGATANGAPAHAIPGLKPADANGMKTVTADNPTGQDITVTFDPSQHKDAFDYATSVGHEGSHVADISAVAAALPRNLLDPAAQAVLNGSLNLTSYATERAAYEVTSFIAQARMIAGPGETRFLTIGAGKYEIWNTGWSAADRATKRAAGIDRILAEPKSQGGRYEVTPQSPGPKLF
jgi:hypothetical protein